MLRPVFILPYWDWGGGWEGLQFLCLMHILTHSGWRVGGMYVDGCIVFISEINQDIYRRNRQLLCPFQTLFVSVFIVVYLAATLK